MQGCRHQHVLWGVPLLLLLSVPLLIGFQVKRGFEARLSQYNLPMTEVSWQYHQGWFTSRIEIKLQPKFSGLTSPLHIKTKIQHGPFARLRATAGTEWRFAAATSDSDFTYQDVLIQQASTLSTWRDDWSLWFLPVRVDESTQQGIEGEFLFSPRQGEAGGVAILPQASGQQGAWQANSIRLQARGHYDGDESDRLPRLLVWDSVRLEASSLKFGRGSSAVFSDVALSLRSQLQDQTLSYELGAEFQQFQQEQQILGPLTAALEVTRLERGLWGDLAGAFKAVLDGQAKLEQLAERLSKLQEHLPKAKLQALLNTPTGDVQLQGRGALEVSNTASLSQFKLLQKLSWWSLFNLELSMTAPALMVESLGQDLPAALAAQWQTVYQQLILREALTKVGDRLSSTLSVHEGQVRVNDQHLTPLLLGISASLLLTE